MDYTQLSDEQLDQERIKILTEQERRANLAHIPEQISDLSRTYREGGGDPDLLVQAVAGEIDAQTTIGQNE